MDARTKMDRAATQLLRSYPFWGSLYLGFVVEETTQIPYTGTDGATLWYNPDYVDDQDEAVLCTDLAHACQHKALLHNFRRGNRDEQRWHTACDYAVNSMLQGAGFKLGELHLYDPQYDGMSEEEIYTCLEQNPDEQPEDEDEGQSGDELFDHPSVGGAGQPDEDEDGEGEPGDDTGDGGDEGEPDDSGEGEAEDEGEGQDPGGQQSTATPDIGESEQDVRVQVAQAREFAEQQGNLPGEVDRAVKAIIDPPISPEQVLQEFMEQCSADDYSWTVPDRRFLEHDQYLPGLESEGIDEFVLAVDASASVNQPMYDHFAALISKITEDLPFKTVHVLFCDTAVRRMDTYTKAELPIDCRVQAGGGTRFSPVFNKIDELGIQPAGLAYLTDLKCSDFPDTPAYPVIWIVDGDKTAAPFGTVLNVEDF